MKGKSHSGKGLYALLSAAASEEASSAESIREINVAFIEPNPFQPRLNFDETSFTELKKSIQEKGVIQPILVRPLSSSRYQVVAGERRLRATIALGIQKIPAYIIEVTTDEEMMEIALIENLQREQLNAIDQAKGYQQLIDEYGLTQEEVARRIGKSRSTVTNVLRLLKLPSQIQKSLQQGEIKEGHARALLRICDPPLQIKIWKKISRQSLSVRSVEELAKKTAEQGSFSSAKISTSKRAAYFKKREKILQEILGTRVKIRSRKHEGTIEIVFCSPQDFKRLMELLDRIKF